MLHRSPRVVVAGLSRAGTWWCTQVDEEDVASTEFSSEALSEFVEAFVAGTLAPYVRSQPVPRYEGDGNTGGRSRPIVAANFDDMVTSTGANSILMFHTPWCQHCVYVAWRVWLTGSVSGVSLAGARGWQRIRAAMAGAGTPGVGAGGASVLHGCRPQRCAAAV